MAEIFFRSEVTIIRNVIDFTTPLTKKAYG